VIVVRLLITSLLTIAVAFPAGWVLCRAWLSQAGAPSRTRATAVPREQLQAQQDKLRASAERLRAQRNELAGKLAAAEQQIDSLTTQLARRAEQVAALRREQQQPAPAEDGSGAAQELNLLRIERDELLARLQRLQAETEGRSENAAPPADESGARAERGELRERLAASERARRQAEGRLAERDRQIEELRQEVESWKHRLAPLARQLQKQREIIRRQAQPAPSSQPAGLPRDDLQRIRGIGPALERRLRAQGIHSYAQLAAMSERELAALADKLAIATALPMRDEWVRQARELAGFDPSETPDTRVSG